MKFFVEGVRCAKCVDKIEGLKSKYEQIENLEVDLSGQTASVEMRTPLGSFAEIAEALSNLGYRTVPLRPEDDGAELWKKESRRDLIRLGVAAFCAGNIMMLAFATYFGVTGSLKTGFEWLQLGLYLPVLLFVAWPFYQGFWQGLRNRSLSIDGPMAIASTLGFAVSTYNLVRGSGSIYFDSTSGFLFLILATRYWQKRTRAEYLRYLKPSALAETLKARLVQGASWAWVRSDDLNAGDEIEIQQGEWVPADGTLLTAEAWVDLSVLDGESLPRRLQREFQVKAGAKLLSETARVRVTKTGTQTLLGNLLAGLKRDSISEAQTAQLSNKAAQVLLAVVLGFAFLTLLIGDFQTQFEKAFALIVLACPCAMAFGTPLAYAFAMKKSQDEGVILKSAQVLDEIEKVEKVFIDKTGTLTERQWQLQNSSLQKENTFYQQIILALEARSSHPIAFALREMWKDIQIPASWALQDFVEMESRGVEGQLGVSCWSFRSFESFGSVKHFGLFENQELKWSFQLSPVLQADARACVQKLQARGLEVVLLSGDSNSESLRIGEELGLSRERIFAGLTPQDKMKIVSASPRSMMIGDGVNDALALQAAQIGIAVKGGVELALRSADVLILNEGLSPVLSLFEMAQRSKRQIKRNLAAALIYNTGGGALALMGLVNPFVAALLMPISSLFIFATTWWGMNR
jgi:Cu2+-exporting ATPase/Cu+-exporting ATPase